MSASASSQEGTNLFFVSDVKGVMTQATVDFNWDESLDDEMDTRLSADEVNNNDSDMTQSSLSLSLVDKSVNNSHISLTPELIKTTQIASPPILSPLTESEVRKSETPVHDVVLAMEKASGAVYLAKKESGIKRFGPFYVRPDHPFATLNDLDREFVEMLNIVTTSDGALLPVDKSSFFPRDDGKRHPLPVLEAVNGKAFINAATLPGLVDSLISENAESDLNLLSDFLLTHTYYAESIDVARLLIIRFLEIKEKIRAASATNSAKKAFGAKEKQVDWNAMGQMRLLNVIRKWVDNYTHTFERNQELSKLVFLFCKEVQKDTQKAPFVTSILPKLEKFIASTGGGILRLPSFLCCDDGLSKDVKFMSLDPDKVADELTLVEFNLFKSIHISEVFNQSWSHKDTLQRHRIAPNLLNFISSFNKIAYGVATQVVLQKKLSDRVEVIKHCIRIAMRCMKLQNFNTCFEIVAGLNLGSVSRLKETWKAVPKKHMDAWLMLSGLVNSEGNYKAYRELIQNKIGFPPSGPVLPYLGMYLSDLTFIEDGNPTYTNVSAKHSTATVINFQKFRMLSTVFKTIITYQQKDFDLPSDPTVKEFLGTQWKVLTEAQLYDQSKLCEVGSRRRSGSIASETAPLQRRVSMLSMRGRRSSNEGM